MSGSIDDPDTADPPSIAALRVAGLGLIDDGGGEMDHGLEALGGFVGAQVLDQMGAICTSRCRFEAARHGGDAEKSRSWHRAG